MCVDIIILSKLLSNLILFASIYGIFVQVTLVLFEVFSII